MKKKKDRSKFIYYVIASGCLLLFAIMLISSLIDIGEKFRNLDERFGKYIEIGFYVLVAFLIWILIIHPIRVIVKSPSLSIVTSMDKYDSKAIKIYKRVSKNIVKNNDLDKESVKLLTNYKNSQELLLNLNYVFENSIKKDLNRVIISNAKTVMISTAICQSARFDMLTVFAVNLKMVKELVERCGFRPSMKNLSKLTINVFSTALIAEGLENLTIDDVMPKSAMNVIGDVPMLGKVLESITQGAANALLTIRIGCVARRYLFSDGAVVTKEDIRRQAYKETLKILPMVVSDTVSFFPKKIVKFFTKSKKEDEEVLSDAK